jgi:hypothetical protein
MTDSRDPEFRISCTYVLRLRGDNDPETGRWSGQLEHVVSGRRRNFRSVEEMLAALAADLGQPALCVRAESAARARPRINGTLTVR